MKNKTFEYIFNKKRKALFSVLLVIIVIVGVTIIGIIISQQYILNQAESRIQDVLLKTEALHHYVQEEMHPAMYLLKKEKRLPEEFYSPDILSSSYITRRVFQHYNYVRQQNNLPLIEYSMASKNPRNKVNLADSLEASLIEMFNNDSTVKKYTGIVEDHGIKHLYYAKPFLRIEQKCLICHGKSEDAPKDLSEYYNWVSGFDWKVGEIPAIEVIKTPLVSEFKTSSRIGLVIMVIAVILVIMIVLYSLLSVKNKIINSQKNKIQENLNLLKQNQGQLVQSEKMASLGVLTAGVAHEINNPLNFINGAYIGLETFFDSTAPEYKDQVSVLLKGLRIGIERSTEIVMSLSHFSRDSIGFDENCNLNTIIDNCLLILKNKYKNRILIDKQYEQNDIIIKGNEGKLHQVFIHILSNAVQSIENRGIISILTKKNNDNVTITITDSGCGISKENISKIFDPFYTTKEVGEGAGLGLSISYTIIKEHNGNIKIDSVINKRTTIVLTFPII